jgi:serine/threonine protein kinase
MDWTVEQTKAQVHLGDSLDYRNALRDEFEVGDCLAQYEWQTVSFPTCNTLHEFDLTDLCTSSHDDMRVKIVGNGYWRDVWVIKDNSDTSYALKTLRFQHDWADRNYDRHRRDAVASERLTSSRNIVDIFGYCGNSGVFEYADGGDIETMLWYSDSKWNATERLIVAYQVATAINDVHSYPKYESTSISHTDIAMSQFVYIDGRYKLNDFNRCRFIAVNRETHQLCGFKVENNPGTFRSPEEYKYSMETEKIDIFAMGNVFYSLVTEQWPFQDEEKTIAQAKIMQGERPLIPSKFDTSNEPAYKLLIKLMRMCWKQNPKERPTAKVVADLIENELRASGVKEDANS